VERRLAAILAMDVVGYSRMMGVDEVGTLAALKAHRAALIDPATASHHSRLVKTTGDGLLIEFASVVDAIGCAVAIQRGMLSRNLDVPPDKRIVFRVGVNIGDIIIEGGDIFGDGVNVAARLEALCEPGGVCISRAANEQVQDKLALSFADLGEHTVKNIARAVGVFGLAAKDIASMPEIPIDVAHLPQPTGPRFRRRWVAAAMVAALAAAGAAGIAWWQRPAPAPESTLDQRLAATLDKALPTAAPEFRSAIVKGYLELSSHRALAIARGKGKAWRTGSWPSPAVAEEKALEKCQQFHDEPCALVATDDAVAAAALDGSWPVRDAPRVRYAGVYNPERIPSVRARELERPEVVGYLAAPGAKAMAFHAVTQLHVVTGSANQRAAEDQALKACNNDPQRKMAGGPCYLYAIGTRVVLPLRATAPMTAPMTAAAQAAPASTTTAPQVPFRAALVAALVKAAPSLAEAARESQVNGYLEAAPAKALAVAPPGGSWRTFGHGSTAIAEERVLEACQARYGESCMLIAVNDALASGAAEGKQPRRPMPRATYAGTFDPQQIPAAGDAVRQRPDVAGYLGQAGPKAAAYHPWGRLFVATGKASQREAEEQALQDCNGDPQRNGQAGPCLLYAVENQVVLPRRATAALTPAR